MVATLYHIPRTISSPIVQILLELDLVNNPIVIEEISFRTLKSEKYLSINPMGTSPAFHDSDLDITIWESGAVLTYLLERYDTEHQFYPKAIQPLSTKDDFKLRSKFLHLQQYIIATVYPFIAAAYLHSLKPVDEQDPDYLATAKHKCMSLFGPVLTKWLGDGPYFLGDDISAVDFLAVKPLRNLQGLGWLREFPALEDFFERVTNRPTYLEAYDSLDAKSVIRDQSMVLIPSKSKQRLVKSQQVQPVNQGNGRQQPEQSTEPTDLFSMYKTHMEETAVVAPPRKSFGWVPLRRVSKT